MRFCLATSLVSLVLLSKVSAIPAAVVVPTSEEEQVSIQTAAAKPQPPVTSADDEEEVRPTFFNDIEVPVMKELSGDKFEEEIKDGYWLVKHHSPWCHHCKTFKPVFQTMYEFYYTSKPIAKTSASTESQESQSSLNSFHPYYNFHFASLDCVAYGSACAAHDVHSFPQVILYKNGEFVKKFTGEKNMAELSKFIEEVLESIRPGSRPVEGVALPKVGATSVDPNATPAISEAKHKDATAGGAMGAEHNEKAMKAAKPTKPANELGGTLSLTAELFQKKVTTTQDPWFIKFYAPWCHHCQAMAPTWIELGKEMKGKLNIGEVNCDVEKVLCKQVQTRGYPTILFFRGGEKVEYDGLRGLGDLLSFANSAVDLGEGVKDVDAAGFKKLEETEEVIFIYFYDHATTTEDFLALERITLSLIGHAKLVKTNDPAMAERFKISTWPRLVVSRDGRPSYYTALAPKDMRDYRKVLTWMKSVWLPIVPELTASNSREIMDGRLVVLGVLSREEDKQADFEANRREIKNAALEWMEKQSTAFQLQRQELRDAKQLRIEEAEDRGDQRALRAAKSIRINTDDIDRKEVGFAWVDGVFWERWIRTTYGFTVKDGERVVVNDEDNRRYWDETSTGHHISPSRTSILETLPKIVASPPKLKPKSTTGSIQSLFFQVRALGYSHPWVSFGLIIAIVTGVAIWGRGRTRRGKSVGPGFFNLDGKESLLGGGGANGKVD